jgi:hypothetical protein
MRIAAALSLLVAALGCGDESEPAQCWDIEREVPLFPHADLDVLLVVGNESSMAEEQAAVADEVHLLVDHLHALEGGLPDLHAAVVSDDGAALLLPEPCPPLTDGQLFVTDVVVDPETGTRELDYTGDLGDQIACMVEVGTAGDDLERPLASLAGAVGDEDSGFRRPGAALAIAIVTDGEDGSPDEVSTYAGRVQARARADVVVSVVSGGPDGCALDGFTDAAPAPRLAAFAGSFGDAGSAVSLCGEAPLLGELQRALDGLSTGACLPDDASSPPECRVSDVWHDGQEDQREYSLAPCDESAPPCFSIAEDALACPFTDSHLRLVIDRGGTAAPDDTAVAARCLAGEPECR